MKKFLVTVFVCVTLNAIANDTGSAICKIPASFTDTTFLPQILALPLSTYIGKPVDSILSVLPSNYTGRGFMPVRVGYSRGVYQFYGDSALNNCGLQIFVDNWQHMTWPNITGAANWDMNLARQETVAYIRVIKNGKCIYGCNDPNYYY